MNRARRAAARSARRGDRRNGHGLPPLCPPGEHRYQQVVGTVKGEEAASVILCAGCSRTPEQVLEESPADREIYRAWLETERAAAAAAHARACPRSLDRTAAFVDGCAGCDRERKLGVEVDVA